MKKFLAMLLAIMMVLAMVGTAFADTYTLSVDDSNITMANHTFSIYQIMTGDFVPAKAATDTEPAVAATLSNLKWGQNSNKTVGDPVDEDIVDEIRTLSGTALSEKVAEYKGTAAAIATIDATNTTATLPAGYYLIEDTVAAGKDDFASKIIIEVIEDSEFAPKGSKPTVDKQVLDDDANDKSTVGDDVWVSNNPDGSNYWSESADHAIGETFSFKLIAKVPADVDVPSYKNGYFLTFNDTIGKGITYLANLSVKVNDTDVTDDANVTGPAVGDACDNTSLTIEVGDIKEILSADEQKAEIVVTVTYDAMLNADAKCVNESKDGDSNDNKVNLEYSNNPYAAADGQKGKTPDDTVYVYSFMINNTKRVGTETGDPLKDAGFKLYSDSTCATEIGLIKDGAYYRPVLGTETAEEMKSDANGKFDIKGLDAGTYYLKETTTPAGYNTAAVKTLTIAAEHKQKDATTANVEIDSTSTMNNTVVNVSGSSLPETGSIGTTIFYVLGSVMVLGAVVLLVTRRRMANK